MLYLLQLPIPKAQPNNTQINRIAAGVQARQIRKRLLIELLTKQDLITGRIAHELIESVRRIVRQNVLEAVAAMTPHLRLDQHWLDVLHVARALMHSRK